MKLFLFILTTLLYLLLDYLMLTFPPVEGVAQNVPLILLPFCYFFGSRFLLRKTTINRHKNGLLIGAVCVVCAIAIPLVLVAYYLF